MAQAKRRPARRRTAPAVVTEENVVVEVGAIAHGGHCVARHEGRVIFVRHALPGETVEVKLTETGSKASFWRGDAVKVFNASDDRVASAWPEAGPGGVGGGELAHVALPAQRAWKTTVLKEAFERFAGAEFPGEVQEAAGDGARGGLQWRTRVGAMANADGRASMSGFRSHDLHPLHAMPLAVAAAEHALLNETFPAGAPISVVLPAHLADAELGDPNARPSVLVDGKPWKNGALDKRDNAPTSVREVVTVGKDTFEYRVNTRGFWQVHREAPSTLVREVLARVGDVPRVLDLYAGSGLFTLPLAQKGYDVTSIESDSRAVKAALRNLHEYPDVTVGEGDVRAALIEDIGTYDTVVLDPPRSGAGKATLEALQSTNASRLVYVACDPVALARDVAILRELGYDLTDVAAHDLFPMTHHVESVATFERR